MVFPPLLLFISFLLPLALSGPISTPSIPPDFTASYLQYVDHSGAFLASQNASFQARITNPKPESASFFFVIVHTLSNTIIWSANRNHPISKSSKLRLTADGLAMYNDSGHGIWSTPRKRASVASMELRESGNLVLLDQTNNILWQSFDFPTDVLVLGQKLPVGKSLVSSSSDEDLSEGRYKLAIGDGDAMLQWNGMNYWKLSMDRNAFRDTNFPVEYMVANQTGVYLIGGNARQIVLSVVLNASGSNFQIVKLDYRGVLSVANFNPVDRSSKVAFTAPTDACGIPYICRRLGVCTDGGSCACAPAFHSENGDCGPTDSSLVLPGSCNGSYSDQSSFKYLNLRSDLDYFSNYYTDPVMNNANLSFCQSLCSSNCSCLGVFHSQSSGSCFMMRNYLGSVVIKSGPSPTDRLGYVKTIALGSPIGENSQGKKSDFPVLAAVLLPISGVVIVIALAGTLIWSRRRRRTRRIWEKRAKSKLGSASSDEEFDFVSIPGLPVRLDYQELAEATDGFRTEIGSGGFGTVYKGRLKDGSDIAVKKITCLGAQGKTEFLTEIAVIGKIHHVNLVRLKGFCTHRGQRLLVYEFMKRGSLDRTLFGGEGPVLEWKERYEIAVGTARGLAYLHSGCDSKIIHCDVKPENILLHDKSQVKLSDFGLSKLLSPDESGLFTTLRGTIGYLAPEWLTSSAISDKTDVYSYGMVLLEIIRGKKNSFPHTQSSSSSGGNSTGQSQPEPVYFPLFALEMHEEGRYLELVDPRLAGRVEREDVEKLVRVGLCCVHEEPSLRPSMSNVVGMLEGVMAVGEPRAESLTLLRFYGRRFREASAFGDSSEATVQGQANNNNNNNNNNTSSTSSYNSLSYISSDQVSGPR